MQTFTTCRYFLVVLFCTNVGWFLGCGP